MSKPGATLALAAALLVALPFGFAFAAERDKVVCKRVRVTGSVMPKKVCMSQAKWDEMRDAAQRRNFESQTSATNTGGGSR